MKKILLFTSLLFFTQSILSQCYESLTFSGIHTIAQKPDGTLWGWGLGAFGALQSTNTVESTPIQVSTATDWNIIDTGPKNTFVIKNNGTLWGVGGNDVGQLGVSSSNQNFSSFQQITTANDWIKVSASSDFTLALKSDGTIWAWGQNDKYQLGNTPATAAELSPLQVGTDTDWEEISAGTNRTAFAIKSDGTIWGWGSYTSSLLIFVVISYTVFSTIQIESDADVN